jgi:hypothetical protein
MRQLYNKVTNPFKFHPFTPEFAKVTAWSLASLLYSIQSLSRPCQIRVFSGPSPALTLPPTNSLNLKSFHCVTAHAPETLPHSIRLKSPMWRRLCQQLFSTTHPLPLSRRIRHWHAIVRPIHPPHPCRAIAKVSHQVKWATAEFCSCHAPVSYQSEKPAHLYLGPSGGPPSHSTPAHSSWPPSRSYSLGIREVRCHMVPGHHAAQQRHLSVSRTRRAFVNVETRQITVTRK